MVHRLFPEPDERWVLFQIVSSLLLLSSSQSIQPPLPPKPRERSLVVSIFQNAMYFLSTIEASSLQAGHQIADFLQANLAGFMHVKGSFKATIGVHHVNASRMVHCVASISSRDFA